MRKNPRPRWPDAALLLAGAYRFQPAEEIRQSAVQSRMLLWCRSGRGSLGVNGRRYELEPGSCLLLPWGSSRHYRAASMTPFVLGGIHWAPRYRRRVPFQTGVEHSLQPDAPPGPADAPGLESIEEARFGPTTPLLHYAEYLAQAFGSRSKEEAWCRAQAAQLVTELLAFLDAPATPPRSGMVLRLTRALETAFPARLPAVELARAEGVSLATVERRFLRELGTGPKEYVSRIAESRARELLTQSSLPIHRVGEQVGYEDPYYFSKWFRKRTGLAPSAFRRTHGTPI